MASRRWRLLLLSPLLLVPLALVQLPPPEPTDSSLYDAPVFFSDFRDATQRATFEISCDGGWVGSGWAIAFEESDFSYIVTAHHVIEDCESKGTIQGRNSSTSRFELELVNFDGRYWSESLSEAYDIKDLALLRTEQALEALKLQFQKAEVGQWVAVAGFPGDSAGEPVENLSLGNITGFDSYEFIVTDAAINSGNSGGPLVNSRGEVLGTVFASEPNDEFDNFGYVQPLALHCRVVLKCDSKGEVTSTVLSSDSVRKGVG